MLFTRSQLAAYIRPLFQRHVRWKSDPSGAFADRARLIAVGGAGGSGCVSFGKGPNKDVTPADGGSGGAGGAVWLEACDTSLTLRMSSSTKRAENGASGASDRRNGRRGADLIVRVPAGTYARLLDDDGNPGMVVCDLNSVGMRACVARGGMGGRGNSTYRSSTNRSPDHGRPGMPGECTNLLLELKTIADVGLVGVPNAGKSTLLRAVSSAKPRVASYAFTTLRPHIGVVERSHERLTVADIPGLIDGAHNNKGLGHEFLRHVERTKTLVYVVDVVDYDMKPAKAIQVLEQELELYETGLSARVTAVVANKMDKGPAAFEAMEELIDEIGDRFDVFPTIASTGAGVSDVVDHLFDVMKKRTHDVGEDTLVRKERDIWLWEERRPHEFEQMHEEGLK